MKRKAKHVLGKKNKNSPWVWGRRPQTQGEFFFFAQNMLRLSGQAAQELQVAQKSHTQLFGFYCIKFLILVSQLSCSRAMERVLHLQDHGISDFSGYTGPILKIIVPLVG